MILQHTPDTNSASTRAIVIGGSIAGLLTARVLSEHYASVLIIERDELPVGPAPRKGTPHAVHTHGLLARGREALEELFPGFTEALVKRGAVEGDLQHHVLILAARRTFKRRSFGSTGVLCSRLLIESELRRRVRALPNVEVITAAEVIAPIHDAYARRVIGVTVRRRDLTKETSGPEETLLANFIVDATGRGSHSPAWLESWGYHPPHEERVTVGFRYATAYFERTSADDGHARGVLCTATAEHPYAGAMLMQEPAAEDPQARPRWVITVGAYQGDELDVSLEGVRQRARILGAADVIRVSHEAPPLGPVLRYGFKHSQRRRYEKLQRFPKGYLVVGDAITSFNPIYGQGMTVAACEALLLRRLLSQKPRLLHRAFFRKAAQIIETPWRIAVGGDLAIPTVEGHRSLSVRLINRYLARVFRAAEHDAEVSKAFVTVMHLLAPPTSLFRPDVLLRVLLRGRRTPKGASSTEQAIGGIESRDLRLET